MIAWPAWLARLPKLDAARAPGAGRWVVVDVESSGLDPTRDRLIAVGALAVTDGAIDLADAFEVVLRQSVASADANIEIHGIGGNEQRSGEEPAEALAAFLRFIGNDPLIAWHAWFDETILKRAIHAHLRRRWRAHWLDLADVVPLAWPERGSEPQGLDGWLDALAIPVAQRHRAIADCLATAQLFAAVLPRTPALGVRSARDLLALSSSKRYLSPPVLP